MLRMYFLRIVCLLLALGGRSWKHVVSADFDSLMLPLGDKTEDELLELKPINSTGDFRITIKDTTGKPWDDHIVRCVRPAKCEKLQNSTCFGGKLPYRMTSSQLSNEVGQERSLEKLNQFEALRNVPKCWAVIQPFLCAVYMPKCSRIKDREFVDLPSLDMCRVTAEPCRILYDSDFFPQNLRCDRHFFPCDDCRNDVREIKFNAKGQCMLPLVTTESMLNQYPNIEGCGLQCKDPMYTDEEHESVQMLIFWGSTICFFSNVFVIATFLIHDWKQSKHPAWNLFYISICFLFNWIGWILQFVPGHRENIVCRRDGTLRHSEPSAGENLACIIPFILIYYFLVAANVWFAVFTYAWYLQTKDQGSIRDRIDKESFYFHFIAWALPFILTVSIMVLSEVDGNSITGICFVGYENRTIRSGLFLVPVAILTFGFSVFFAIKGVFNLNCIKRSTASTKESKTLSSHILGMGIRTMLIVFFIFAFFVFENYEARNSKIWAKSLNDFIICKIKESYSGDMAACKIHNRPSVAVLQLRLICLFCVNLVISSWCWTWPTLKTWNRFLKKKIGYELSEDEKFTKPLHRVISDIYAKRNDDVISVSIQNSHTDPAGLNFDINNLNSTESNAVSPSELNYLCMNMMNRRNAVTMSRMNINELNANCATYTSSYADNNSEISVSVRHFAIESRRSSFDSQVSVKMSEMNIKATLENHSQNDMSGVRVAKSKKRHMNKSFNPYGRQKRRTSSSSLESQKITNQMQKVKYKRSNNRIQVNASSVNAARQIERRSAVTTDDINYIQSIFSNGQHAIELTSDDDDQSNDESRQRMHIPSEPSNMLVKYGGVKNQPKHQQNQMTDSNDSLDASNDNHPSIEQIMEFVKKNGMKIYSQQKTEKDLENSLTMSSLDQQAAIACGIGTEAAGQMDGTRMSFGSSNHSSSFNRLKTHSQNSKRSCDVGIQANDFDIASHSQHVQSTDDCHKDAIYSEKYQINHNYNHHHPQDEEEYTESHQLLVSSRKKPAPTIVGRKDTFNMKMHLSESEKREQLNKLLLPSK